MKKLKRILITLALIALLTASACAETFRFSGVAPAFTAADYETGASISVTTEKLLLLGLTEDGQVLAYADNALFTVAPDELGRVSSRLASANLPELSELSNIRGGSPSSAVETVQRALTLLGYLSSSIDGSYGSRTAAAVSAFQADRGLEETGIADPITQRILYSLAGSDIVIRYDENPAAQFAAIEGRTEANLEALQGQGLSFEYDDISGKGFIGNGSVVTIANGTGTGDIDSYSFTLRFGFAVAEGTDGVTVTPSIEISNTSVRRPILQSLLIKSGDSRVTIKVTGVTSALEGSRSVENGTVKLNDDAVRLLKACAENGELKLRIAGKYDSYDVIVPEAKLAGIAKLGELTEAIKKVEE